MGITMLKRVPLLCLFLSFLPAPLQGLEILDPEEIEYIKQRAEAPLNGSVTLHCGSTLPNLFIWGYSPPGLENNTAIAYNYGPGPKILPLADVLGEAWLVSNSSTLVMEKLTADAEGLYTCQALYDTDDGPKVAFYITQLNMQNGEDGDRGSGYLSISTD